LSPVDRLPQTQRLNLAISLPLRNKEGLTNLLQQLYDPASPQFHHYLTPQQFAAQFGPAEQDYQAVVAFAQAHNLKVTATHPNRAVLSVNGSVADIEKALHATMRVYQHPQEARSFFAPDADPSLDLAVPVLAIEGLNNYVLPYPKFVRIPMEKAQANPKLGSGPFGTYMGYDFRDAYAPGVSLTGAGQVVALFELDGYFPTDIQQYESMAGLPNVPLQNVLLDGTSGVAGFANGEVALDIEMAIAMAPGLDQVIVYEGFVPLDIINRIATDDLASQISCSWGWEPFDPATDQTFQQMAAQGQTFYDASGDSCAMFPPILPPSDDPYITQVGGTTLSTTGPNGSYVSETVWNVGFGIGSSGGSSGTYRIPTWQQPVNMTTNMGSTTKRNFPDVALTADNIIIVADDGFVEDVGGTSAAAPLWAGFTALVNQQAVQSAEPTVGFINPAIYSIGLGSAYNLDLHDITVGNNTNFISTNLYYACPGYDLCTGWGTPTGSNLINTLAPPVFGPVFEDVTNVIFGGNGNGVIDEDECNELNVVLANNGPAGATSVRATLFSSTPGVFIAQPSSPYPDMPVGSTATNSIPFRVSTTPDFNCGVPVHFTILIKCDQTTAVRQFTLSSGQPGTTLRFDNLVATVVTNGSTTSSPITVSNSTFALNKVTVSLFLTDFDDGGIVLQLISPDKTTNTLSANNGFGGQNYGVACSPDFQRTTFDDNAGVGIASSAPPFSGAFQPQQPLSIFFGKASTNVNGTWRLQIANQSGTLAYLQCWSLFITPTLCVDGGGECPGSDLGIGMTAKPQPVTTGNNLTYSILVTNFGPSSASNVVVSQFLPTDPATGTPLPFVAGSSSQGSVAHAGSLVTCNLGLLRPRATASISVTVQTMSAGKISSTATVSSEQPDYNPANNTAIVASTITPTEADLALTLTAVPLSTYVNGPLTYTVTVTNNGPDIAIGAVVTNWLPSSVTVLSSAAAQGSLTTLSNSVVVWEIGTITNSSLASATISVTPTTQGQLVATSTVYSDTPDPVAANNTAHATTVVGPAADLAVGILAYPSPVVVTSNLTYVVSVTNFGPSVAVSPVMTATLPSIGVNLISSSTPSGTISVSGNVITANLTNLNVGGTATITIVVAALQSGVLTTTVTVSGSGVDPNPVNNTAIASTVVSLPSINIAPAGALLTYESGPQDGSVDPGESVTMQLGLENLGNIPNTNLVATLLATGGVTPSGAIQRTYGVLKPISVPGVFPVSQPFSFTANGPAGGTVTATLLLQDVTHSVTNNLGTASFVFPLPNLATFANTNFINIPANAPAITAGPADPYPSTIEVSGLSGQISKVTATLSGFYHGYPQDVSALLVGPLGQASLLLSHAGTEIVTNLTLTFDDTGTNGPVPLTGYLNSGDWQPTAYAPSPLMSNPAPVGPYSTSLSAFNGFDPTGTWSLYVLDDSPGDTGGISSGWSLTFTTVTPVDQVADLSISGSVSTNGGALLSGPVIAGTTLTYTFIITNGGPANATFVGFTNVLPVGATLVSFSSSQGTLSANGNLVFGNLGLLNAGATASVTTVVTVPPTSSVTSTASVALSATEIDYSSADNTVTIVTGVALPLADVGLTLTAPTNSVVIGSNLTFTIGVTNYGPDNALNVVVTNPVPASLGLVSATPSIGTASINGNTLTANLGTLAPGAGAAILANVKGLVPGTVTDVAGVVTNGFSDTNALNNSATTVVSILNLEPEIVCVGALVLSGNGVVLPGQNNTVSLMLANIGAANATNLTATLLASGGVTPLAPAQKTYGRLNMSGVAVANTFSFTATSASVPSVTTTLQLQDGSNTNLAPVSFTFYFPATIAYSNSASIVIPDHGEGIPYPSAISQVSSTNLGGVAGVVTKATATLHGFGHTFPEDVSVLLAGPTGESVLLMAHTGGGNSVTNLTLTFDEAANNVLSEATLTSGTYRPSIYSPILLPSPAAQRYATNLSVFDGISPNGTWSLYVFDDRLGDAGIIANGWSLNLTTTYASFTPVSLSGSVSNQQFHLTGAGSPDSSYIIQGSANLLHGPWLNLSTNTAAADGTFNFVSPINSSSRQQFYRAVSAVQAP